MKKRFFNYLMIVMIIVISTLTVHAGAEDCVGIFGPELIGEIKSVLRTIQIIAPIILLLLTSLDFAKVVFGDNKDGLNKAKNNFLKRAVAVLIIFFAPYIIGLILDLVNEASVKSCVEEMKNLS